MPLVLCDLVGKNISIVPNQLRTRAKDGLGNKYGEKFLPLPDTIPKLNGTSAWQMTKTLETRPIP